MHAVPLYAYGSSLQDLQRNPGIMLQVPEKNPGPEAKNGENAPGPRTKPWTKRKKSQKCRRSPCKTMDLEQKTGKMRQVRGQNQGFWT